VNEDSDSPSPEKKPTAQKRALAGGAGTREGQRQVTLTLLVLSATPASISTLLSGGFFDFFLSYCRQSFRKQSSHTQRRITPSSPQTTGGPVSPPPAPRKTEAKRTRERPGTNDQRIREPLTGGAGTHEGQRQIILTHPILSP